MSTNEGINMLTACQYRELFRRRATGEFEAMECTKQLYTLLEELYFEGMTILDIPCGVGHYYRVLKNLGDIDYVGADLDHKCIQLAEHVWREDDGLSLFCVKNILSITKENIGVFDVVICYNMLLHLDNFQAALRRLLNVTGKHLLVRSLFGEESKFGTIPVSRDYKHVYPRGKINYNVYSRDEVRAFINWAGDYDVQFIDEEILIPPAHIEAQAKILKADPADFSLESGYEILFVTRK